MGHVIHQNDCLVKPYQIHKRNIDKKHFCYHGDHKTGRFGLFFSIFGFPDQEFGGMSPRHGACNAPKWESSEALSGPKEKKVDKNYFGYHGNHKTGRFRLFLSIFGLPHQGCGVGAPDMSHVIHQNDRLVKAYRDHKKTLTKNLFVTMATLKLDDFADFLVFSWLLHLFSWMLIANFLLQRRPCAFRCCPSSKFVTRVRKGGCS